MKASWNNKDTRNIDLLFHACPATLSYSAEVHGREASRSAHESY